MRATSITITLAVMGPDIVLAIVDDGIGIEPEMLEHPCSHGILGMRERMAQCGGQLTIGPGPDGVGTMVCARLPAHR
jgi:signal transduction histidine kinase